MKPVDGQNQHFDRFALNVTLCASLWQHFGDGVKSANFNTFDPVPKVTRLPQRDKKKGSPVELPFCKTC